MPSFKTYEELKIQNDVVFLNLEQPESIRNKYDNTIEFKVESKTENKYRPGLKTIKVANLKNEIANESQSSNLRTFLSEDKIIDRIKVI